MKERSRSAAGIVFPVAVMVLSAAGPPARGEERVLGRVRVSEVNVQANQRFKKVESQLASRFQSLPAGPASTRILAVAPHAGDSNRFDVTVYDYSREEGLVLLVDAQGKELRRNALTSPSPVSGGELRDAFAIVSERSPWADGIASGLYRLYAAMPAITTSAEGRRLVNVGVLSTDIERGAAVQNEIVSVSVGAGDITRYPDGAPPTSRAAPMVCGGLAQDCPATTASCDADYHVEWPSDNPIWKFDVTHPACTRGVQPDGTGLALRNVFFRNRLVLERADMPVLDVKYDADACGPYRDWLFEEGCFDATGTDAFPGFRVTTSAAVPATFCESGSDSGSFRGIAIHDEGSSLWIVTEMEASWYRYVMQWRLHVDGTIEPIFGFGATSNACICNLHHHHAYWRFEWALDGIPGDPATGITALERRRAGSPDSWDPVTEEGRFVRPAAGGQHDLWRIRNPQTGLAYVIEPGPVDGSASSDPYAAGDFWALAYHAGEIDDPNPNTRINVDAWLGNEPIGTGTRLVSWYHASYDHLPPPGDIEPCDLVGPKLFVSSCAGSVGTDKTVYRCDDSVQVTLSDSDLAGAGMASVRVASSTESSGESVTLLESPTGTGRFAGTVMTTGNAPVQGNGKVSVANRDTISVVYVDASQCGTPDIQAGASAKVDCAAPVISDLRATATAAGGATISWYTREPSTSIVHFGTSPAFGSTVTSAGLVTAHTVALTGLAGCTEHHYWVASADAVGNEGTEGNTGPPLTFTTGRAVEETYAGTDVPLVIPDANNVGATSTIHVADGRVVDGVRVTVHVTHTWDADLTLSLVSPSGVAVALSNGRGGSGDDFAGTVFDDGASAPIAAGAPPFAGTFRPESPLGAAAGIAAAGDWKLKVVDGVANDVGTIDSWSLTLVFSPEACGPHAKFESRTLLRDTCVPGGGGTGDGVCDAGETVDLAITLRNDSASPMTDVTATISSIFSGVGVVNGAASFGDLAAGAAAISQPPSFSVRFPSSLACGTAVPLDMTIVSRQGSWTNQFRETVGQGTGPTTVLDESFSGGLPGSWTVVDGGTGGGVSASWTAQNPGSRPIAPPMSAPVAVIDSDNAGQSATQDEQLITPVLDLSGAQTATLEFDQYFYWWPDGLDEFGDVDVRSAKTGGTWINAFRNHAASSSDPDHRVVDITDLAAGAGDVRIRFRYYNAAFEWWWQVDNVKVTKSAGCRMTACAAGPGSRPPVPDGAFGEPVTARRADREGSEIAIAWDVAACRAVDYHLVYGGFDALPTYALDGSVCRLGHGGTYTWTGVPAGSFWFLLLANDGGGTESTWGVDGSGANRNGTNPSVVCGILARDNAATCP